MVTDLDDAGGPAVVDKITSAGGKAIYLHQDVSLEKSWPGGNRGRRPALWTSGRNDRQRRYRHPVQSGRNVVGRLATANCSQPGRCVPVSQIRRSSDATCWRWLHYHYVIPLLASAGSAGLGAVAPRREACACSRRRSRWNVPQKATASGSTPSTPGSSTHRFGRKFQHPLGAMRRSIRTRLLEPGYLSAGPGRRRILQTVCCSSPLTRPAT